jgi:subtilisin family serine protease
MSRAIRIGIVDSGVHAGHPHVGNIAGGVVIANGAPETSSYVDHLGHGTAIAALIHSRARQADLFAVKIFHRALVTNLADALAAIDWCLQNEMDLINLSLGTTNGDHRSAFEEALTKTTAARIGIISAFEMAGVKALPGSLTGVVAVAADRSQCPGEHTAQVICGKNVFSACPFPREIPGVSREQNLRGVSFAVAHVTATLASLWNPIVGIADWEAALLRQTQLAIPGPQTRVAHQSAG